MSITGIRLMHHGDQGGSISLRFATLVEYFKYSLIERYVDAGAAMVGGPGHATLSGSEALSLRQRRTAQKWHYQHENLTMNSQLIR